MQGNPQHKLNTNNQENNCMQENPQHKLKRDN